MILKEARIGSSVTQNKHRDSFRFLLHAPCARVTAALCAINYYYCISPKAHFFSER